MTSSNLLLALQIQGLLHMIGCWPTSIALASLGWTGGHYDPNTILHGLHLSVLTDTSSATANLHYLLY